jgi:DNA-binding NtrC family response regulator
MAELEMRLIHEAVRRCDGDKRQAAKLIQIGRGTLYRKLRIPRSKGTIASKRI